MINIDCRSSLYPSRYYNEVTMLLVPVEMLLCYRKSNNMTLRLEKRWGVQFSVHIIRATILFFHVSGILNTVISGGSYNAWKFEDTGATVGLFPPLLLLFLLKIESESIHYPRKENELGIILIFF